MADSKKIDVIIVGAGISGLSAAKLLREKHVEVLVLEARGRVGGRTLTVKDARYGGYTDLGGSYFGETQRHVIRMAQELGVKMYKVYSEGKSVMEMQGKIYSHDGTVPPIWNPLVLMDFNNAVQHIDNLCNEIPIDAPWNAPKAAEWDAMTMRQFIDKISWTSFTRQFLTIIYEITLAVNPAEASLLYSLWYTKSCQGLSRMISTDGDGMECKFVGGSMQISEKIAELLEDRVLLNEPVIRIDQSTSDVTVVTATGKTFKCNYVISGMPQALLNRINFIPSLPAEKIQLFQRMPLGSACKAMIFYERAYWREKGLSGQTASDVGLITVAMDDTKPDGTAPCLIGLIVGDAGRKFAKLPVEERKKQVAQYYARLFQSDEYLKPIEYVDLLWPSEEYSGGCYVSALPPGVLSNLGYTIREPIGRVFFAGTESSFFWSGYMNGAIEAGERAARQVLCSMGLLKNNEIEKGELQSSNYAEEELIGVKPTLVERMLPSVPTFLLLTTGILMTAIIYHSGHYRHLAKLTDNVASRWR